MTSYYFTCSHRFPLSRSKSIKQTNKEREPKSIPANTVQSTSSTNPQPRIWRLLTFQRTLCNWRAHLKQSEIWRKTVDKRNKTQKTPGRTRTYTNAHLHHVDAHSLVRCLYCPLSKQWCEQIVKTPWWTHKNMWKAKHINLAQNVNQRLFASRISDSAVQCQHSHTKSGEVCLEVKQRALPWSFRLAENTENIDITITIRNTTLVERLQVRTWKDKDDHLHGRW